jgi:CheY-like chemotaxis protein
VEAAAVLPGAGRVLVMDDEESLRALLRTILSQLGYGVQTARDGAETIALYEQSKAAGKCFDAVLLDLTVTGGMGGVEAAARLKAIDPSAKLIVSSGYSDTLVLSDFRRFGFDASIPKPWTVAQLSEVFSKVVGSAREPSRPNNPRA